MKSNAKQSGSGGRLRLGLLMASVAAFLLVPVAAASAAEAEIVFAGSGSGTITGGEPVPGEPPLDCFGNAGAAEGPICTTETQPLEGFDAIKVEREAAPGSKFAGFKVIAGQNLGSCAVESFETTECAVLSFGEKIIIEATFELEPNVHIEIDGEGSGSVVGVPTFVGSPPVDCEYVSPGPATGDCDVLPTEAGGFTGINVKQEAAPGSEFAGWTVSKGFPVEGGCGPLDETCGALILGPHTEIIIKAKFDLFVESFPLNLTTSGSGEGSFECNIGGEGFGACPSEVKETESVEVKVVPNTGSELAEWTTGPCTGESVETCAFVMPSEGVSANAEINLETFEFTLNQEGEGAVLCNGEPCPSGPDSITYGDEIEVTTAAAEGWLLKTLSGPGCEKEAGTCSITVTGDVIVSVTFAPANTIDSVIHNVHGEVPETTELSSSCGPSVADVDLGTFTPGVENRYWYVCNLTVTSTGEESDLTAKDEASSGAEEEGHLSQVAGKTYNLPEPLEMTAESTIPLNGVPNGGLEPLDAGGVTLMSYPTPVSADSVDAEFSQWIRTHDPLHTGVYSKEITLTLEQTEP